MNKGKRQRVEAAGFRVGDARDFLGLSDEECQLVELRLAVADAVRKARTRAGYTQEQVARQMQSTQARVAKIEAGMPGVSLDLSFRALFAAGGKLGDVMPGRRRRRPERNARNPEEPRTE